LKPRTSDDIRRLGGKEKGFRKTEKNPDMSRSIVPLLHMLLRRQNIILCNMKFPVIF
jgi:hypothetical protein